VSAAGLAGGSRSARARETLRGAPHWAAATPLAALGAIGYLLISPQSPDLAAASYRSHLFSLEGLTLWDNSWYGGHHLLAYSLLAPALGAAIGPALLAALSMVAATALFAVALRGRVPARAATLASLWFAFGAAVALLSSRVPFDLGLALALAAVVLAQRGRGVAAGVFAVLASVGSPVAGAFLAMAMLAWALAGSGIRAQRVSPGSAGSGIRAQRVSPASAVTPGRRLLPLALCVLALAPIVVLAVVFPEGGTQPFVASAFWPALAGVVVVGALIPSEQRTLRIGAMLYALVLLGSFSVPSAVGGNADRLGALATGPIAAAALLGADRRRRLALLVLVAPLVYWQVNAPITDFVSTLGNPATEASYYAPLLAELKRLDVGYGRRAGRIEVVPTVDHWEARYVAPAIMIARGWERQLDRYRNGLFYSSEPLAAWRYLGWLREQGIDFVALPDAPLDYSGKAEARLLEDPANSWPHPAGFLRQIWSSPHWRLFAMREPRPLAQGFPEDLAPAGVDRFLHIGRASFSLRSTAARSYVVLVRYSPYWAVTSGEGCVAEAQGGWTTVRAKRAGTLHVSIDFSLARVFSRGERCS
jgi:hypothetical protein